MMNLFNDECTTPRVVSRLIASSSSFSFYCTVGKDRRGPHLAWGWWGILGSGWGDSPISFHNRRTTDSYFSLLVDFTGGRIDVS